MHGPINVKNCIRLAGALIVGAEFECKLEAGYGCLVMNDSQTDTLHISVPQQPLNAT
jgi:hypothetical protein